MSRVNPNALPGGSAIHRYTIHNILGQGGFGITYLAHDKNRRQLVAIKEYLPPDLATRSADGKVIPLTENYREDFAWGLERFTAEARILSKFEHPNIVRVLSVFETKGTAYMTMRYEDGMSLAKILERGATLDENWLKNMVLPIIDGLRTVHRAGFIHRDIKPGNIYIRKDQSPVLLDFGSARRTDGVETKTLTTLVSPGYAPFEQYYARSDKQGARTDIYGLGATLYRATVGAVPCDAIARSEALLSGGEDPYEPATSAAAERYSTEFLCAIDHALSFREERRPRDLAEWARELDCELVVIGSATVRPTPEHHTPIEALPEVQPPTAARGDRRSARFLKAALSITVAAGLAAWLAAVQPPFLNDIARTLVDSFETDASMGEPGLEPANAEVDRLLNAAWQDLGEARFIGPGKHNALARLRRVLEIDPDNETAHNGMAILHGYFLSLARRKADEGKIGRAVNHARQAAAITITGEERAAARRLLADLRPDAVR